MYAYAQYREWAAEHHRFGDFDIWLEVNDTTGAPGIRLPAVPHESGLPDDPMYRCQRVGAIVRVVVDVRDRFPLKTAR
jgi:hypothetical protein